VIDPTGALAWVTNRYDDSVSVIDVASRGVSATIPVGTGPNGISYSPRPPAEGPASIALNLPAPTTVDDGDHGGQPPAHHPGGHAPAPTHHPEAPHPSGHP
ncbi:MAG TPA: hypothetical protein P5061_00545, partial [Mycobacterium sp.]|nr:hypothetical protein [Mycobacterium sp.]